jgi:hypothetical protein
MSSNRRNFLIGTPFAALGLSQLNELLIAEAPEQETASDVVDYWVRGMKVPPHMIAGGQASRGRGPETSNYAREPLFLHYDPDEGTLIPSLEIPTQRLNSFSDAKVDFQLARMRLNDNDDRQFRNYTSGGIYLDFQQAEPVSLFGQVVSFATSTFSAIFPGPKKAASGASGASGAKGGSSSGAGSSGSSGGSSSSGSSNSGAAKKGTSTTRGRTPAAGGSGAATSASGGSGGAGGAGGSAPGTTQLQAKDKPLSLVLPGGVGKTSFAAFAKDRKKTAFGNFIDVMAKVMNSPLVSYMPLLNLPLIGGDDLMQGVKSLVGNLQAQGAQQQFIIQGPITDVSATADGAKKQPSALRFRTGDYVVIPKEHSSAMKPYLNKLKVLDGYLVPKEAGLLDIYDAAPNAAPDVSYFSVRIQVAQARATTLG